jgi:hypothetical protein
MPGGAMFVRGSSVSKKVKWTGGWGVGISVGGLRLVRPLDLSAPKARSVAYVRREHHLPTGFGGPRFIDKHSEYQLQKLFDLGQAPAGRQAQ